MNELVLGALPPARGVLEGRLRALHRSHAGADYVVYATCDQSTICAQFRGHPGDCVDFDELLARVAETRGREGWRKP